MLVINWCESKHWLGV